MNKCEHLTSFRTKNWWIFIDFKWWSSKRTTWGEKFRCQREANEKVHRNFFWHNNIIWNCWCVWSNFCVCLCVCNWWRLQCKQVAYHHVSHCIVSYRMSRSCSPHTQQHEFVYCISLVNERREIEKQSISHTPTLNRCAPLLLLFPHDQLKWSIETKAAIELTFSCIDYVFLEQR